jgi:membrane-bound lytic murein transglycosylase A
VWQRLKRLSPLFLFVAVACEDSDVPVEIVPETPTLLETPADLSLSLSHWDALDGWGQSDLRPALDAFMRSCERMELRPDGENLNPRAPWAGTVGAWRDVCVTAALTGDEPGAVRATFEALFSPVSVTAIETDSGDVRHDGLLTGYYEPFVEVRSEPVEGFTQPLRARPDDLLSVDLGRFDPELAGHRIVARVEDGELVRYRNRADIESGDFGEAFAWGRPIDVFFLQIQGSGRLIFEDGRQARAAFNAHNGLPYRSIGRELINRGELARHAASKAGIEAWLNENGPEATAELFSVNPRYVFFGVETLDRPELGPRGSSGVSLTPMASLAVDTGFHAHGVPIWMTTDLPDAAGWSGLLVSQDSGGAINGPLRGDFFWGWGQEAERRAGTTNARAQWTVLLPHTVADRIVDLTPPA